MLLPGIVMAMVLLFVNTSLGAVTVVLNGVAITFLTHLDDASLALLVDDLEREHLSEFIVAKFYQNHYFSRAKTRSRLSAFDQELELACRAWVQQVAGVTFDESTTLQEELKSGVVLCQLCNAIKPGVCKKPSTMSAPFKQMENIAAYLTACDQLGVPQHSSFQTVTLYEDKDMMQVLVNLQALGSAAQRVPGYSGPTFGAKLADANVREFSEEVLKAGLATQTFLGTGSHGQPGTQSGMFDTNREIVKSNATPSATPTFLGTGSHGVSGTQSGMVDTRRNIVKAC